MMKHKSILIGLSIVLISLSSCVNRSSEQLGKTMLEYSRTGGFAGFDDHLQIDENGKAILTRRAEVYEFSISADKLKALHDLCERASFSDLQQENNPKQQGFDLFEYEIVYEGLSVKTVDSAIPNALQPIINELNQIILEYGK